MSPRAHETDPVKAAIRHVRGYMILGSILIGSLEAGFRIAGANDRETTSNGVEKLWSELRTINETLGELRTDMKVLQESEKQNVRRDIELTTLENRLGAVEIQAAKTEARLPKG